MFTGIIEETGTVTASGPFNKGSILTVECKEVLDGTKIGDSIAINGACQTVTELSSNTFSVFASYETLNLTTLGALKNGNKVNLERALRLCDRLGGHIVSGHVDGIGTMIKNEKIGDSHKMTFSVNNILLNQIVKKGSITVDGVSLTVADIEDNQFSTAVIPHTFKNTLLKDLKKGSRVNIETDIVGKYIEKLLEPNNNKTVKTPIDADFLERNGFV